VFNQVIDLLSSGKGSKHLSIISPYITVRPVKAVAKVIDVHTEIDIVTDFSYDSFMHGASSLGAFVFLSNRPNTKIFTVDRLHAKAYIWGDQALVGSANFTDRGLGFSQHANVEILTRVGLDDESVKDLMQQIEDRKRSVTQPEIQGMIAQLSCQRARHRAVIRQRVHSILSRTNWLPSCSLRYLIQYLTDGSLYRVPLVSRANINDDAHFLESKLDIVLISHDTESLIGKILEIPIVQLAVECRLRGDMYLAKCLKATGTSPNQIDALENWSDYCISYMADSMQLVDALFGNRLEMA
jgi:hypothetical protein